MGHLDPIAYTYEADCHCPDCAFARFGQDEHGFIPEDATDDEGNSVGVVAPWSEWWNLDDECEVLACGTCHAIIDNAHRATCEAAEGDEPCTIEPEHRTDA